MLILTINPGSTSTKVAIFADNKKLVQRTLRHDVDELEKFNDIMEQEEFRKKAILDFIESEGYKIEDFSAIACRGGILPPLESGTYVVDENMVDYLKNKTKVKHASNLAAVIGFSLSSGRIPVYITDPVSVDEMIDEARISGIPEIERLSLAHALNIKAVAREVASQLGKKYEELNMVIAHLGGGISVTAHEKGRMIDVNNANDEGPFSPERTGELPVGDVVKLCFSGKYSKNELKKLFVGKGGLVAYVGTNDVKKILEEGSDEERFFVDAMVYQIAKEIGGMCAVLKGKVDAIVITGGIANNPKIVEKIKSYVFKFAPVFSVPGEFEMEALAMGALRVLRGEEKAKTWGEKDEKIS
ncbi:butyrate kinase [Thermosipho melanesiensis]|uniref:Probable butyrate kinase n=2 Tax=Thermosipho melanesiensis TaxID=46541 RepID=A6LJ85_THEM4|nr:Butyrate kinase [Thermosipho melanesiensis BI429]APT73190.1 butyrate kinase [Thermosipho melanesiensis]OOC38585.1 butyrate kinase [Thermosipho melanesiensis]OOC40389.1 butyrate kinase [Thermosipho melanesiensis]OOC40653.1 butyrate kinase [Thermosipho melanesiensis]